MNQDYVWTGNGPSQALDGSPGGMPPSALMTRPLADSQRGSWTSSQAPDPPSRFTGLLVQTQKQRSTHACGLPSPAPTAPAASPPHWPNHDVSSVAGSWAPTSPISPAVGEPVALEYNSQFLYPPNTAASVIFDTGFHDWAGNTGFPLSFDHTYPGGHTAPPVPNGLSADFSAPWPSQTPGPSRSSGQLLIPAFEFPPPSNSTTVANRILPLSNTEIFKQENTPQPHPYPLCKRPLSHSQQRPQPHKRAKAPSSNDDNHSPPPTTTDRKPRTKPLPSTHPQSPTSAKGPTLRTAARRVKRPAPSLKPGESPAHQRARTNHNLVEQQYRHRLHARFEALLDVLPDGILGDEEEHHEGPSGGDGGLCTAGGGGGVKGKNNRRMSKVDVLSKAQRVIQFLQGDTERMKREMEEMRREKEAAFAGMARVRERG
ncbi:uncharacterized protein B0H64DRAFT_21887 [Chaetomium fimeti]|uniref:BHLH domain-containing protein n=1 Tax=Chaetomium fimeti TaxID=1854472 RepID=A0AAE0HQJ8_9PEZI|nr:hypothetical protein B0H64DRAFT_21887 [Chaetomium fimeti]